MKFHISDLTKEELDELLLDGKVRNAVGSILAELQQRVKYEGKQGSFEEAQQLIWQILSDHDIAQWF